MPVARPVYEYSIKLTGKEKQKLRQAKKKSNKNARLAICIFIILMADAGKIMAATSEILGCCEGATRFWACEMSQSPRKMPLLSFRQVRCASSQLI